MIDSGITSGIIYVTTTDIAFTAPLWNSNEGSKGNWKVILTVGSNAIKCKAVTKMGNASDVTELTSSDNTYSYILSVVGITK